MKILMIEITITEVVIIITTTIVIIILMDVLTEIIGKIEIRADRVVRPLQYEQTREFSSFGSPWTSTPTMFLFIINSFLLK